ncbi:MAG: HDOD domain-containing protein [Desulfosarcinaceae bacterium]
MADTPQEKFKNIQLFISRMPSLSTTVAKVLEICNDPNSSPNDLNKVISFDPVLTGQVLKLINSAYYGLPNRIASLTRAIIMLGLNTVKNLVLATSVLGSFKGNRGMRGFYVDQFWEHSLGVGVTARVLARILNVPAQEQEEYFVTGLLHDLGKLPIMSSFPALYEQAIRLSEEMDMRSYEAENHFFGFDHSHVNQLIFARWKLGAAMANAAACHHRPFGKDVLQNQLLLCICLADETVLGFNGKTPRSEAVEETMMHRLARALGVDARRIFGLQNDIEMQIEKARVFLNIDGKGS